MHVVLATGGTEQELTIDLGNGAFVVGDLVAALTGGSADRGTGLLVDGVFVPPATRLSDAHLREGVVLVPASSPRPDNDVESVVEVRVVGGLLAGERYPLGRGSHLLGREGADIVLDSATVSPRHAQLDVSPDGTVVIGDLQSRNGTAVEGYLLPARCRVEPGQVIQLGAVQLGLGRPDYDDVPSFGRARTGGTITFNRPPRSVARAQAASVRAPAQLKEPSPGIRFSPVSMVVPALGAVAMAVVVDPRFAIFGLLSPVMMGANALQDRRRVRRERAEGEAELSQSLEGFRRKVLRARTAELARRRAAYPDPAELVRWATSPSSRLWERRAGHDDFLQFSLGLTTIAWTPTLEGSGPVPQEVDELLAGLGWLRAAPLSLDLSAGHVLGVTGERGPALAVLRSLICQAAVLHGPADLRIAVLTEPGNLADYDWLKWLPHVRSTDESSGRTLIAAGAQDTEIVLDALFNAPAANAGPVTLVVVDGEGLTEGRNARPRDLLAGAGRPVAGIVLAASTDRLPAVSSRVLELAGPHGLAVYREPKINLRVEDVVIQGVPEPQARRCARMLARFEDPEVTAAGGDLPREASLVRLLDVDPTGQAVADRWTAAGKAPRLAGPIGACEQGDLVLDLVGDGPHGLIAGTTGAGKSELLRSLVASLATNTGPEHLNFVLVDYKGGSAFAEAAELPHTVGLVTDLDEHLGQRALRSLEAELRYREQRLRDAGASDLPTYLAQGHREPLPRLVVIVDEFATMAAELPDFIDSLVGVAQRGRSLGVHMILATQRPGGAVNDNIRANTNLRISLRVQDPAESNDVIASPLAASIGRSQAGRGYVRLGPGEVFPFQAALVTGRTRVDERTEISVHPFEIGANGARPATPGRPVTTTGPTDLEKLVSAARDAAALLDLPPSRRPWLPPLPSRLALDDLSIPTARVEGTLAVPIGLADNPDRQAQQPFSYDPTSGNMLLTGVSGAGTTTALATIAVSLARAHPVDRVHLYVLDFGTQALAPLALLPHVGAVVGSADKERQIRLIRYLGEELQRRRRWVADSGGGRFDPGAADSPFPAVVLLLDNYGGFFAAFDDIAGIPVRDQVTRLAADGPGLGITVVMAADRPAAVPQSVATLIPHRLIFRLGDPQDVASFGIQPRSLPRMNPGRAIDVATKLEIQVALAGPDGLAAAVEQAAAGRPAPTRRPQTIGSLPDEVKLSEIAGEVAIRDSEWVLPVGIGDTSLGPVGLRLGEGDHILVAGPPRSGKSTTLDALASLVGDGDTPVTITAVALRRSPLREANEVHRLVTTADAIDAAVDEILADALPQLILVDDVDQVEETLTGAFGRLVGSGRADLHVIAAGRADVLKASFGHWTQALRRSRQGLALKPNLDQDGDLWSLMLPRRSTVQFVPGRGYLVAEGQAELVQAARR